MYALGRFSAIFALSVVGLFACKAETQAPSPLTTINAPQGGRIVYGLLNGATTQSAALSRMLRAMHNNCGEKPQIGRVFQFIGSNSVGVFFTVTDHPDGNVPVAGMVIATMTGPNTVEAGMVFDTASRFAQTVNPMLQQLSSVWHPNSAAAASNSPAAASKSSAPGSPVPLHKVKLSDDTATVSIPAGWTVDPQSWGGTIRLHGTNGEVVMLNNAFIGEDPNSPGYRNAQQMGMGAPRGLVIYPANADLVQAFPNLIQQFRRVNGLPPANLKIENVEPASAPQGTRCAQATLHVDPNGKGMQAMFRIICTGTPYEGVYPIWDYYALFPNGDTSQARALGGAIFASFQMDVALVTERGNAEAAPHLAQLRQNYNAQQEAMLANGARIVGSINQIGANATARMNATEAANDAQHAQWSAGQVENSRNIQGFSNYLLDQTVVQNNYTGAHATGWNAAADALVQSDPNKYSYVNTPNYVPGTDF
jgi:hypothetical protein